MAEGSVGSQEEMDQEETSRPKEENIMDRVRQYLSKRKSVSQTGDDQQAKQFMEKLLDKGVAGTYSAILSNKKNTLQVPNLNGMGTSQPVDLGTFFNEGDLRMKNAHFRTNFAKGLNVSFSFDPSNLNCNNCGGGSHKVVGGGRGGGGSGPGVYLLADQNFPPVVPDSIGMDCLVIIRVENGSLLELANVFLETFRGCSFGLGSLVLLSSATHLAWAGVAAYAEDFVRASRLLSGGLGAGVSVRHGLPLLLGGTNSPALIRSLFELGAWLSSLVGRGEDFPSISYKLMLEKLSDGGGGDTQPDYAHSIKLPVQLMSFEKKVWVSKGFIAPSSVPKMAEKIEGELIQALILDIRGNNSIPLGEFPVVNRQGVLSRKGPSLDLDMILVGASHANRLSSALEMEGLRSTVISMPSYSPNKGTVERAAKELEEAVAGHENPVVVFQMLDNAAYYAKTEEGALIPARRSPTGSYHLDGDLVVAPKELFSPSLKVCEPLFQIAEKAAVSILLSPMPRYWTLSCCEDVEHAPNRADSTFEEYLFSGLDGIRRHCKDFLFLHRYKNTKVLNSCQLLTEATMGSTTADEAIEALRECWGSDPVHPGDQCYREMAKKLVARAREKETSAKADTPGGGPSAKRARWLEEPESGTIQLYSQRASASWTGGRGGSHPVQRGRGGRGGRGDRGPRRGRHHRGRF